LDESQGIVKKLQKIIYCKKATIMSEKKHNSLLNQEPLEGWKVYDSAETSPEEMVEMIHEFNRAVKKHSNEEFMSEKKTEFKSKPSDWLRVMRMSDGSPLLAHVKYEQDEDVYSIVVQYNDAKLGGSVEMKIKSGDTEETEEEVIERLHAIPEDKYRGLFSSILGGIGIEEDEDDLDSEEHF
jgi:hypothetical protein